MLYTYGCMNKHLVIVESPAKARTIEKYLGKDYTVKSSFGHIRDLPKKGLSIDIDNGFTPTYEVGADKKKVVSELKKAAKNAQDVWLASDEDREGEAIAWHLAQALGLDTKQTKRIVFHEITEQAIKHAVQNPRTIDIHLVDAQQARRVLDRLVGYELSPVLWKKVRTGLSAGRVQSVAVRLAVEREREIKAFDPKSAYKVTAKFLTGKKEQLAAELPVRFDEQSKAKDFLTDCIEAIFKVSDLQQKPATRSPSAPFTTSSLQQEASRRLGFSVKQTMTLAQRLYENGHISYMRTDSTILSQQALAMAQDYINKSFGAKYHEKRQFQTKNDKAQEAHEAIRPTNFNQTQAGDDPSQQKLYQLIWQRTIASQMAAAQLERSEIVIDISSRPEKFTAKGEVLVFDGFYKVYGGAKDDTLLPDVKTGDKLLLQTAQATETFSRSPARYSEASLVKKLEELGIGRPSTYAPTISTIQSRDYVEKRDVEGVARTIRCISLDQNQLKTEEITEITGADRNKLVPTFLAEITTDFLLKYFADIVDYDFTAKVEKDFDHIAAGKQQWAKMIQKFYQDFHPLIKKTESVTRQETAQARLVGNHPKTNKPIYARYGRYGAMLQMGETEDDNKPAFAPLPVNSSIDNVTLEQAVEMFTLPRIVGTTKDGQEIKANIGRFGPYIQVEKLYVSIKPLDPLTITEDEARLLYQEKLDKQEQQNIAEFPSGIKVLNGRYGPYVTNGKKNARILKDKKPESLTEEEAKELLDKAPAKKRGFRSKKK